MESKHELFMKEALNEASKALKIGETPVGCVVVKDGEIIGRGHNMTVCKRDVCKNNINHYKIINFIIGNETCRVGSD